MATHLSAIGRDKTGKMAACKVRHQGLFPAIIYGSGGESVKIALDPRQIWKQMHSGKLYSSVYKVDIEGGSPEQIIVRDIQFHPVTDKIIHADFFRVDQNSDIDIDVPMHFLNQETCEGLKRGGILNVVRYNVPIRCKPQYIPEYLEVDLEPFKVGDSLHISHVSLPENVSIPIERDFTIATIAVPRGMSVEEEEAAAEESEESSGDEAEES